MDLVYADSNMTDIGVLKSYTLDLAYGSDENDLEITTNLSNNVLQAGYFVYIEDTEYGGIIDGITVNTREGKITFTGRTWHGMLNSKIVEPDAESDYLVLSGDLNTVIGTLITRVGLTALFVAPNESSGITVSNYQFDRYAPLYDSLNKLCRTVGAKLKLFFNGNAVSVSAERATDYSDIEEFSGDQMDFVIEQRKNTVNHLVCLGKGELAERQVIHLYVQQDGSVGDVPCFTGTDEITDVYDYSSVESLEELRNGGIQRLEELSSDSKLELSLNGERTYDIGDIVGGYEVVTGISAIRKITKKIVKIEKNKTTIQYKVGE